MCIYGDGDGHERVVTPAARSDRPTNPDKGLLVRIFGKQVPSFFCACNATTLQFIQLLARKFHYCTWPSL